MLQEDYTSGYAVFLDYLPTMLPQIARLLEAQANGEREETVSSISNISTEAGEWYPSRRKI